jgi:hypothetical protein
MCVKRPRDLSVKRPRDVWMGATTRVLWMRQYIGSIYYQHTSAYVSIRRQYIGDLLLLPSALPVPVTADTCCCCCRMLVRRPAAAAVCSSGTMHTNTTEPSQQRALLIRFADTNTSQQRAIPILRWRTRSTKERTLKSLTNLFADTNSKEPY